MEFFIKYLYFFGSIIGLLIFIFIYLKREDLRTRMISAGIAVGIIGILSEYMFFQDYWNPPLLLKLGNFGGIEDFLFGLAFGGIGVVIYDVIFHKRLRRSFHPQKWIIPIVILSEVLTVYLFFHLLKINSIYASAIGFVIPVIVIISIRKDLIKETIFSAILAGLLLISVESFILFFTPIYLEKYFLLHGKILLIFGTAPITELIWGMCFGAIAGPLYDFKEGTGPINLN
jgi:hypothetical protein